MRLIGYLSSHIQLALVFSRYTHKPSGEYVYQEYTSDKCDIS